MASAGMVRQDRAIIATAPLITKLFILRFHSVREVLVAAKSTLRANCFAGLEQRDALHCRSVRIPHITQLGDADEITVWSACICFRLT